MEKLLAGLIGILQHVVMKNGIKKRVRFTRFDSIDNQDVANALFSKVENWAKEHQMEEIVRPLGFSDLDRRPFTWGNSRTGVWKSVVGWKKFCIQISLPIIGFSLRAGSQGMIEMITAAYSNAHIVQVPSLRYSLHPLHLSIPPRDPTLEGRSYCTSCIFIFLSLQSAQESEITTNIWQSITSNLQFSRRNSCAIPRCGTAHTERAAGQLRRADSGGGHFHFLYRLFHWSWR